MMSLAEAHCAVVNAARALKAAYPNPLGFAGSALVQQLYAAVDAVDAVGERDATCDRTPGMCLNPECWEYRWMGGRYCFVHREREKLA